MTSIALYLPNDRLSIGDAFVRMQKDAKNIYFSGSVGLSNILDSELIRRAPAEGSHGQVVGAAVMDGKLLGKVVE